MSIKQYIMDCADHVERYFKRNIRTETSPTELVEAMSYSFLAGGKRLRPALAFAANEAVGGSENSCIPIACAIEMIHSYSLIHDDLPAMDNDDFRRGKPTNHKVFGEAMAILAGDGLLTHAFYVAATGLRREGVQPDRALAVIEELSKYAGIGGMVGGQTKDILSENAIFDREHLESIHRRKTGDLIVCSLRTGAIVGGANDRQLQALTEFGYLLGLAFQIQDDVLDVIGDEQKLGKKVGGDEQL